MPSPQYERAVDKHPNVVVTVETQCFCAFMLEPEAHCVAIDGMYCVAMTGRESLTTRVWRVIPIELALVVAVVLLLVCVSLLSTIGWFTLVRMSLAISVASAMVGIPLEAVYFGMMIFIARREGNWQRGWIWRSFEHHARLSRAQRWVILPFFFLGAMAFAIASLATAATVFGLFLGHQADWKPG